MLPDRMFSIPDYAPTVPDPDITPGGFGASLPVRFASSPFSLYAPNRDRIEADDDRISVRFSLWLHRDGRAAIYHQAEESWPGVERGPFQPSSVKFHNLFPCVWASHCLGTPALSLESLIFTPLLPDWLIESSLPIGVVVWRIRNNDALPMKTALMLSVPRSRSQSAAFDFQHDNLCLTGSLGEKNSPDRWGIAVPDLHHEGIYLQGIEPWMSEGNKADLWQDFADDGELEPVMPHGDTVGMAAWVKFDLAPGERKEIPFVLVRHAPFYEVGPAAGRPRYYTQFPGKRRPDNAVVWLAEQAVQTYGTETPNYRHWLRQIADWHAGVGDGTGTDAEKRQLFERLALLPDAIGAWTDDNLLSVMPREGESREALAEAVVIAATLWPGIRWTLDRGDREG